MMKISSIGLLALLVAPAQAFSARDYGSPTAARASYGSIHSDTPANDPNYLKSLGGGATMKSGRNFSGVSSSFRQIKNGSSYLDNLKEPMVAYPSTDTPSYTNMNPSQPYTEQCYSSPISAPVPYGSIHEEVPASSDLNYLKNLGGSTKMKSGRNYSGVSSSFKQAISGTSYLETLTSPTTTGYTAPQSSYSQTSSPSFVAPSPASSYVSPATAPTSYSSVHAEAPTTISDLNYLKTLGGSGKMKSGRNYSGVSSSFRQVTSGSSYLDAMKNQAGHVSYSSGGHTPQSYVTPLQSSSVPTSSSGSPAAAPASYGSMHAEAPASSDLNYLKTLGGSGKMKSGRNYSGVSSSFKKVISGSSYLEALKNQASHVSYSSGEYTAPQSYATPSQSYSRPTSGYSSPEATPESYNSFNTEAPASTDLNYLKTLGGSGKMKSGRNYSGVGSSFRQTTTGSSYLDSIKNAAIERASEGYGESSTQSFPIGNLPQESPETLSTETFTDSKQSLDDQPTTNPPDFSNLDWIPKLVLYLSCDNLSMVETSLFELGLMGSIENIFDQKEEKLVRTRIAAANRCGAHSSIIAAMAKWYAFQEVQMLSCRTLHNFGGIDREFRDAAAEYGAFEAILQAMKNFPDYVELQKIGCAGLCCLSSKPESAKYLVLGLNGLDTITKVMKTYPTDAFVQVWCCSAINNMSTMPELVQSLRNASVLEILIAILDNFTDINNSDHNLIQDQASEAIKRLQ